ncbi:hypothetical protein IT882_04390 [Microbacterium schleiferi]|uniref:Uncharacterized protein n=1 Tax=Microbacterium schleiferi TaxID=69362 RepID=A0A7S8MZ04_9MICO|nr:hypothetical protein [Microbacterium schleiferi]QPE05313.1 hypothetical protein IT882_04390 [Microbacterium schleiferi]
MKIKIKGIEHELVVRKTTRILAEFQNESGINFSEWEKKDAAVYGTAFAAWCALRNAGYEPKWDDLIDRDIDEFEVIQEPGDSRDEKPGDVADPPVPSLPISSPVDAPVGEVPGGQLSEG